MTLLSELFPGVEMGAEAGMILGDRIAYTTSTTLTVVDHEALAPKGYELFGWRVKPIGGGASGGRHNSSDSGNGGYGGSAPDPLIVLKAWLNGAASVNVIVGAGGAAITAASNALGNPGGQSSFGSFHFADGGPVGIASVSTTGGPAPVTTLGETPMWFYPGTSTATANELSAFVEGQPGFGTNNTASCGGSCPSGKRGGGGGGRSTVTELRGWGGAVYPHPNASGAQLFFSGTRSEITSRSATQGLVYQLIGRGNPDKTSGAPGHPGIGDYPGGGGNGNGEGHAGAGGFPGGGGGACNSNSSSYSSGKGGDGVVYVYPIFRKAI